MIKHRPIHLTIAEYEALLRVANHCRIAVAEGTVRDKHIAQSVREWETAHDESLRLDLLSEDRP